MVAEDLTVGAPPERPSFETYGAWLKSEHDVNMRVEEGRYESASLSALTTVQDSDFYKEYLRRRADINDRYERETSGYKLFASPIDEPLQRKSWSSFLEKTWRKNVVTNKSWPAPPEGGWYLPSNWFSRINDVVRASLVVKYLDGVSWLQEELREVAAVVGVQFSSNLEARDEGYYAAHTYTRHAVGIPERDWQLSQISLSFELQITTQLQEVIRKLTHREYEQRRTAFVDSPLAWQWDYSSPSFTPNYLGHILHYMEGLIMEVRERGNV